jgi:(R,R)-butanediol dehydrogenase/meso-butanediol dehydrogenase/diacetyl reductase
MRAARFYGKEDLRYEENVAEPQDILPGQVLVKPTFCGICGTDLHEYRDGSTWTPHPRNAYSGAELPQILGHEFAGEVVEVGAEVTSVKRGDRVSIQPQVGLRTDYFGRQNLFQLSKNSAVIGLSWPWGGMSDLALVNEYNAYRLPDDVSDELGAMIEPAAVAVAAVDRSNLKPGDRVLVTGGGPIGVLTAMAARAAGASRIVISEPNPARRKRIEALDIVDEVLDPAEPDFVDRIRSRTPEGIGVDAAFECAGNARAFRTCTALTRPQGTVVQVGILYDDIPVNTFEWLLKDLTIRASLAYETTIWPRIMSMMQGRNFPVERMIDARIGLEDVVQKGFLPLVANDEPLLKVLVVC